MRSFTVAERRARLGRRQLLAEPAELDVTALTARLVGLHATDPATPFLSLWARSPGFAVADLEHALYESRRVVKHLAMRRTLWVLATEDLAAVQSASSDRVAAEQWRRLAADVVRAEIAADGDAWLTAATAAVLGHLTAHGPASARTLRESLPELAGTHDAAPGKPWGGATPISPRVLTVLGAQGHVLRGPNDGAWTSSRPLWAATSEWLGAPVERVELEAARAALVRRWLWAFGPATTADVGWWFGNTLTWTRAALRDVGAVVVDLGGEAGWALPDDVEPEPDTEPWVALLPGLDPTVMGWQARDWYLGEHRAAVFDRNGNAGPTAWVDGRVVGGWRADAAGHVEVQLVEDVAAWARKALQRKAAELTEWLGGVTVKPRFPAPLAKG